MSENDVYIARFRSQSRQFQRVASVAFAVILTLAVLTVAVAVARWDAMGPRALSRLALIWAPAGFYLWALWTLRAMFAGFARGGLAFQPAIARAISRVGWALLLGAATTLATSPLVLALTVPHRMGGFAAINLPALTLGVVGLALIAVAAMMRRGMALEAQTASLKATLDEFF